MRLVSRCDIIPRVTLYCVQSHVMLPSDVIFRVIPDARSTTLPRVTLRSIIACASSDVGQTYVCSWSPLTSSTILAMLIRRFIKWFLSRLPMSRVIRDIICCALYSTAFDNVFCVFTRGFMNVTLRLTFSYVDSLCVCITRRAQC
jgi:hypothetical protein